MTASSKKIDVFPHIMPRAYHDRLAEIRPQAVNNGNVAARPVLFDLDERFRMMDRYEGYVQVLTLSSPPIEELAEGGLAADLARLANDSMAELTRVHPDRFLGFAASIALDDVDTALREVDRAVRDLGALGVQIFTNVKGHPLDEPRFEPFFARMAELDRTVWVHPARTADMPDYPSESRSKYALYFKLGWPYETSVFVSRMIFSGIMGRYPGLRVLTHHAAGIVPHLAGRLVLHHDRPELRRAIGVGDEFTPEYVLDCYKRFYGDTVFSGAHHPLDCALDFFGPYRILFGTDMPYGAEGGELFVRETIAAVEELDVDASQRAALFESNARAVLGLP